MSNAYYLSLRNFYRVMEKQIKWEKLLPQTLFWFAIEIYFNFLGIDNLADYSEFLSQHHYLHHNIYQKAIA